MRFVLFILLVLCGTVGAAQNLVPNGSFEEYTQCPSHNGQIDFATGWVGYYASPDYFNACNTNDSVGVPANGMGYQTAADGYAYAGAITYEVGAPTYRECFRAQLLEPLQIGVPVYLSMKVSPGGFGLEHDNSVQWASKNIGMRFCTIALDVTNQTVIPNAAAIHLDQVLTDTATWTTVSGMYVPDSAYDYVMIGNFFADSLSAPTLLDPNGGLSGAYAFVDEVCVSYDPLECDQGSGITEHQAPVLLIAPNPCGSEARVFIHPASRKDLNLQLIDREGRLCWRGRFPAGESQVTIPMSALAAGVYSLQAENPAGVLRPAVLIHVSP
jgi:hypothetical protein